MIDPTGKPRTIAVEMAAGGKNTPDFAWTTAALFLALFATFGLSIWLAALLWSGFWREVLVLWVVPWWLGQIVMLTFFTWTPHHGHIETGRCRDTRIALFPGANLLLIGQNHHLIHHMMPGVPFNRYDRTLRESRTFLEQNDAWIEGFWPTTHSYKGSASQ